MKLVSVSPRTSRCFCDICQCMNQSAEVATAADRSSDWCGGMTLKVYRAPSRRLSLTTWYTLSITDKLKLLNPNPLTAPHDRGVPAHHKQGSSIVACRMTDFCKEQASCNASGVQQVATAILRIWHWCCLSMLRSYQKKPSRR